MLQDLPSHFEHLQVIRRNHLQPQWEACGQGSLTYAALEYKAPNINYLIDLYTLDA